MFVTYSSVLCPLAVYSDLSLGMARSILDVLQGENPSLDSTSTRQGNDTFHDGWQAPHGWHQWKEFSFRNLSSIYDRVLQLKWEGATAPKPELIHDRKIRGENTLGIYLAKFMMPGVNKALVRASRNIVWVVALYLAPECWTGTSDWRLVSRNHGVGS